MFICSVLSSFLYVCRLYVCDAFRRPVCADVWKFMLSCSSNVRMKSPCKAASLSVEQSRTYQLRAAIDLLKSERPQGRLYLREVFFSTFAKSFLSDLRFVFPRLLPWRNCSAKTLKARNNFEKRAAEVCSGQRPTLKNLFTH